MMNIIKNSEKDICRIYVCSPLRAANEEAVEQNRVRARLFEEKIKQFFERLSEKDVIFRTFAPHAYISYMLDDNYPSERMLALETGIKLLELCDYIAVGGTRLSAGMKGELRHAVLNMHIPILLLGEPDQELDTASRTALCADIRECLVAGSTEDSKNARPAFLDSLTIYDCSQAGEPRPLRLFNPSSCTMLQMHNSCAL